MTLRRRIVLWAPAVVWAGVIFGLSSIPSLSSGLGTWDEVLRKGAHIAEYAVLGMLLLRVLGSALPAFAVGVAYAITDEIRQHDAILERLDALRDELQTMNKRLDHTEGFLALAHEVRSLNESLQALAYAALGQQGPQVRRRRTG